MKLLTIQLIHNSETETRGNSLFVYYAPPTKSDDAGGHIVFRFSVRAYVGTCGTNVCPSVRMCVRAYVHTFVQYVLLYECVYVRTYTHSYRRTYVRT